MEKERGKCSAGRETGEGDRQKGREIHRQAGKSRENKEIKKHDREGKGM